MERHIHVVFSLVEEKSIIIILENKGAFQLCNSEGYLGERAGKHYITYPQLDHIYVNKHYMCTKCYNWIYWQWSNVTAQN